MTLGQAICEKRKGLRISQEEFANKLGVARQTVSSWERDVFVPDGAYLIALSKFFGCPVDDLLNFHLPPITEETPGAGREAKTREPRKEAVA